MKILMFTGFGLLMVALALLLSEGCLGLAHMAEGFFLAGFLVLVIPYLLTRIAGALPGRGVSSPRKGIQEKD